jgi:hypothetical protein
MRRAAHAPLAGLIAVALSAACAAGPEYKPRLPGEQVGYTDQQLSPTRYRVAFSGSTASNRDDVENYLLRRSAEVTAQSGYTHFAFSRRDTERSTNYISDYYGPYYYYPYRSWYWGDPYGTAVWPVTSYFAFAEIVMLSSDQAAGNSEAIEALTILARSWPPVAPLASADRKSRS